MKFSSIITPKPYQMNLEKIVQQYLGKSFKVISIKEIPGGFKSKAFIIEVKNKNKTIKYFLKHSLNNKYFSENKTEVLNSYLLSDQITSTLGIAPISNGVFMLQNSKLTKISRISDDDIIFQLQEYADGENYFEYLFSTDLDEDFIYKNKGKIESIAVQLSKIHKKKISIANYNRKQLYKKALRNPIINPELGLSIIDDNIENGSIFQNDFFYLYIVEMMKIMTHFSNNSDRLCIVHGDFWPGNILFQKNQLSFVDYSRYFYGDPGIDVGHFYLSLIWFSIMRNNKKYINLAEYFLKTYILVSKDKMVEKTAVISFGSVAAVCILENFFPDVNLKKRKQFAKYVLACMEQKIILHNHDYYFAV